MNIVVAGLINIETTLKIDGFPLEYNPVRFPFYGVNTTVSGVGFNISKALHTLGHRVKLLSMIGQDAGGALALQTLGAVGLPQAQVLATMPSTAQSVILYEDGGRRAIFTNLKDIQERQYPVEQASAALAQADLAVICNINFSRPLLALAQAAGVKIATDVHAIRDLFDSYNRDYLAAADILFMSHENLPLPPQEWARRVQAVYNTPILVIGMGTAGALLATHTNGTLTLEHVPAVTTRPVISTIGAGDSLFSAFLHTYLHTHDPSLALRKAVVFASWKIGTAGGAEGFLSAAALDAAFAQATQA